MGGKQKLRQETGYCEVFTFTIYYLFEALSRVNMQIKAHGTGMNRVHSELNVSSLYTRQKESLLFCVVCFFIILMWWKLATEIHS